MTRSRAGRHTAVSRRSRDHRVGRHRGGSGRRGHRS